MYHVHGETSQSGTTIGIKSSSPRSFTSRANPCLPWLAAGWMMSHCFREHAAPSSSPIVLLVLLLRTMADHPARPSKPDEPTPLHCVILSVIIFTIPLNPPPMPKEADHVVLSLPPFTGCCVRPKPEINEQSDERIRSTRKTRRVPYRSKSR